MCRHLAWVGAPRTLASLLLDPPWSLLRQSYEPRRQTHGRVNADGFGVGWYDSSRPEPARYRRTRPIWTDANLASFAPVVTTAALLGAVRSATVGMPVEESATAPFTSGSYLLSLNGAADRSVLWPLLGDTRPESLCDAALLAALVLPRMVAGEPAQEVLTDVVARVGASDPAARLTLLLTDGRSIHATAWGASLTYLLGTGVATGGTLVASEPLDDDRGWVDVPDRCLLTADPAGVVLTEMES